MRLGLAALIFVVACAGAGRAPRECPPNPIEYASYGTLYRDCGVDLKARLITQPSRADFSRLQPLATSSSGCYTAEYQFIIDEQGMPIPRTVRLIRTNSQSYADAIRETLGSIRFEPARKDGIPVQQVYDFATRLRYTVTAGASPSSRRPPPC